MVVAYTDGSCLANGKTNSRGGFGVVIVENDLILDQYQHFEENTTNNAQELKAILWVLLNYGKRWPGILVYSDSAYCVNTLTQWMYNWARNGWLKSDNKSPENLDLIKTYYDLEKRGFKITLEKIKGHAGNRWNEMADQLATGKIILKGENKIVGLF